MLSSPFELLALCLNLAYVSLAVAGRRICFPLGALGALCYGYVVLKQGLMGQAGLQVVYFLLMFDGWFRWGREESRVSRSSPGAWLGGLTGCIMGFLVMGWAFGRLGATAPWPDAFATSFSLWAQVLLNQRKVESWLLWWMVNMTYLGLYLEQELPYLALLHLVYVGLSVQGLRSWIENRSKP